MMLSNKEDAKVVKRLEVGKVSLFYLSKKGYRTHGINGQNSGYVSATNNMYVKRGHEAVATHLGSNKLVSKNFKKAATEYFKDCISLVEKLDKKEFTKWDIREIIRYYNRECE